MHIHTIDRWRHQHQYDAHHVRNERYIWWMVLITVFMMVVEITAGSLLVL